MPTFSETLSAQLRRDPSRPFVTFYDHATGERTELSLTTYANWVAKAASLLAEEGDLERGDELRIDLPTHWMATVFLGAAWTLGAVVSFGGPDGADGSVPSAVVCGPDTLAAWADAGVDEVFACSLSPLGQRFTEAVPPGVHDVGVEIWSQPDAFVAWDVPGDDDVAVHAGASPTGEALSQAELMQAAAVGTLLTDGGRLLSTTSPASPPGVVVFTEPLVHGGSLVLLRHPDPGRVERVADDERVTHRA
ncbi:MAG: TIGR03089 family protein [Nocardioides sp.]|uniref:TIGR03089 family protein n=1 Tax=Nocardioides sp. TaxID=35761 RepID=UPI003F05C782